MTTIPSRNRKGVRTTSTRLLCNGSRSFPPNLPEYFPSSFSDSFPVCPVDGAAECRAGGIGYLPV